MRGTLISLLLAWGLLLVSCGEPEEPAGYITVASTTSTQNSGLFGHLLPLYAEESGIGVRVVAVGTGQALRLARAGDADVLLGHHRPSEEQFVADGFGIARRDVMYNDFVLVGPEADPAGIAGAKDAPDALRKIAKAKAPFVSRGDDSGTHRKELSLWKEAKLDPAAGSGEWYREAGSGMGATLNTAAGMGAYTMSDRATWISFKNKEDIRLLFEGDQRLFNPYGVIVVNPEKHPHVKVKQARDFAEWLVGPEGQKAIAAFRVEDKQLFFPNARGKS